jgi:hypothetical protein
VLFGNVLQRMFQSKVHNLCLVVTQVVVSPAKGPSWRAVLSRAGG